jgi:hypothetical protein
MVVVAIIVALFAIVAVAAGTIRNRGNIKATEAQIQALMTVLDEYKSKVGSYPPDGFDSEVKNKDGVRLVGAAALYHFLSNPISVKEIVGGNEEVKQYPAVYKFRELETTPENPDYPGVHEVRDAWGVPLHYDNTEDGEFRQQGGSAHTPEVDDSEHPEDPREGNYIVDGENAVDKPGIQSKGYDLWSHGEQVHDHEPTHLPIASWNVK